jgi:hypothetical protein
VLGRTWDGHELLPDGRPKIPLATLPSLWSLLSDTSVVAHEMPCANLGNPDSGSGATLMSYK